jgi:hypothetical protein
MVFASVLLPSVLTAQETAEDWYFARGFYVNATSSTFKTPIFRPPQNGRQVPVEKSVTGSSFAAGYESVWDQFGFGVGVSFWKTKVPDFTFDPFDNTGSPSPIIVSVRDASFGLIFFDMTAHILPWERGPVDLFLHLGLGSRSNDYHISYADQPFTEWVGPQKIDEFEFSYGLGIRVKPVRFLSVFAEYRLAPGDLDESSGDGSYVVVYYSDGTSSGSPSGSFSTYTKIFSLGVQATLEF